MARSWRARALAIVPRGARAWLRAARRRITVWPPVGFVRFGSLRRLAPISAVWGYDRGLPIDRYYIEQFLASHVADVQGRVLEVADDGYTKRFANRVTQSDVLDLVADNPRATIVADLTSGEQIPSEAFDCIILTQTLHLIYDVPAAIRTLHRVLKPGGVVLATVPGLAKVSRYDMDRWGDHWRFTTRSARALFAEVFLQEHVTVRAYGNILAAVSFLHGLSAQDLRHSELEHHDPDYELLVAIRAEKLRTDS